MEITNGFEKEANKHYNSMDDNTQIDNAEKKLTFVKMSLSRNHMDFIMDYYKMNNLAEVNQAAIYILKSLAHMEQDGYKFAIFKTIKGKDGKEIIDPNNGLGGLNISDMIHSLLKQLKKSNNENT